MIVALTRRRRTRLFLLTVAVAAFLLFEGRLPSPALRLGSGKLRFKASSVDWSRAKHFFPPENISSLPRGRPKPFPRVQFVPKTADLGESDETRDRRAAVKAAFVRSWSAYREQAWTWDELRPVSGGGTNTFGGWAATLVDSLDVLWIMGLHDDFYAAGQVAAQLDWANTTETSANVFETTIRHLGGLLSAFELSGERALLRKARELGDMLYMAFDTPNGLPGFWINWADAKAGTQVAGTADPSASPGSLCLEFTRLAQLTGEDKYWSAVDRVRAFLYRTQDESQLPGMWPRLVNFQAESVVDDNQFTLGALADSLYEYLPKMYILTGGLAHTYKAMYQKAMITATDHVLFRPMLPDQDDILFSGNAFVHDQNHTELEAQAQHLGCFAGGMFLLGGQTFAIPSHVSIGEKLTRGCVWAYAAFPSGLMPEIFELLACPTLAPCAWDATASARARRADAAAAAADADAAAAAAAAAALPPPRDGVRAVQDARYILRPEAVESVFYLYRVTGDAALREVAWAMFQSVVGATETPLAYSAIADVRVVGGGGGGVDDNKKDSMESFWTAETLKYFYLIFSPPDLISLDEWVLNTEAHPFRRPK